MEKFYTISDLATAMGVHYDTARVLVIAEPGVIRVVASKASATRTRQRPIYRIPESVVRRIMQRMAIPCDAR